MLSRCLTVTIALFVLAAPLAAFERGDVLLENHANATARGPGLAFDLWQYSGGNFAIPVQGLTGEKSIPYSGAGHFLVPLPNKIVFHQDETVLAWDGALQPFRTDSSSKQFTEIFRDDTELSEIAPMRSGNFLVAERWTDNTRGAKLIEFNLQGRVAGYAFPELIDPSTGRAVGARHIELLSDQCTVLYAVGKDHPLNNVVRRMNICTGEPRTDFGSLVAGQYAGSIRQLRDGSVLIANGSAVLQFSAEGSLIRSYSFPGVTHLALTPDGTAFWAAGIDLDQSVLRRFNVGFPDSGSSRLQLGNDGSQILDIPLDVSDLVVAGEWRAATVKVAKTRSRSVRH